MNVVERFLFGKVERWIVIVMFICGLLLSLFFGWSIRHHLVLEFDEISERSRIGKWGELAVSIASFPSVLRDVVQGRGGSNDLLVSEQRFEGQTGFIFTHALGSKPNFGYVLVNRYDGDAKNSVSELWDLNTQQRVHTWTFARVDEVWGKSTLESIHTQPPRDHDANRFRNIHALLDENGSLYAQASPSPMIKADSCSALSLFQDDSVYHHSIERDHEGNFWVPNHIEPKSVAIGGQKFRDDGIVLISPDGEVLFKKSVVQLLDENGLGYLIYGKGMANEDPIHLNDIQPALVDGRYWRKGDVFMSLRHQSMVLLYRPSTNQVIWHKQGPWLHQHDVDILNDHQISIFNNNAITEKKQDWTVRGVNNVMVYDFDTAEISSPWQAGFEKLDLRTVTEGRGEIVGNEVFVEETNYGRLIQFTADGSVSWQFINRAEDGKIYRVNWSRLIPRELGDQVRVSLSKRSCP